MRTSKSVTPVSNRSGRNLQVNTFVVGLDIGYGEAKSRLNAVFEEPETVGEFHDVSEIATQLTR